MKYEIREPPQNHRALNSLKLALKETNTKRQNQEFFQKIYNLNAIVTGMISGTKGMKILFLVQRAVGLGKIPHIFISLLRS